MEPTTAKVISILTLGLGSFVSGMLPATFTARTRQRHPLLLSTFLCFGAGVLLATSLVHMLPEARKKLPIYSELALCVGFFLVYLIDEIVHFFYGASGDSHSPVDLSYGTNERSNLISYRVNPSTSAGDGEMTVKETCCGDTGNPRMCHVSHTAPCNKSASGLIGLLCALFVHSVLEGLAIGLEETSAKVLMLLGAVSAHKYVVGFCLGVELCESLAGRLCAQIVCVLVFSAGSAVGIAVGAGMDASRTLQESVVAVPLMQLMVCVLVFSVGSAVGIAVGACLDASRTLQESAVGVPLEQALAAGTLLYVTVSEILPRERARWHNARRGAGAAQLLAVAIGFGLMCLTTMYLDHDD